MTGAFCKAKIKEKIEKILKLKWRNKNYFGEKNKNQKIVAHFSDPGSCKWKPPTPTEKLIKKNKTKNLVKLKRQC